jgi:serine/threonine-protein kinase HipA
MGGARAKAVVEDDEGLWIAKFPMRDDRWNNAAVERGMLELARECGIETPESRIEKLGGESVLLVKRFDRSRMDGGYLRHRMVSALTVLGADEVERGRWSYVELADELGRWSERVAEDRRQLFRRMVFNALISNTDDHPRNHAMIAQKDGWRLSPAYDLTPEPSRAGSVERELAMTVGEGGRRANRKNLMSAAERFALSQEEAAQIVDEMLAVVAARWNDQVKMNGASAGECTLISSAFLPEGFEF